VRKSILQVLGALALLHEKARKNIWKVGQDSDDKDGLIFYISNIRGLSVINFSLGSILFAWWVCRPADPLRLQS
jgi:hypothetical protein